MARKRRAPGEGSIFQRRDGMWVGSVEAIGSEGQRTQRRVYARTYAVAKKKLKELRDAIDAGLVIQSRNSTVGDWLDRWLEIKRKHVGQSTYKFYEEAVRLHIKPHIAKVRLGKLTTQHVYHVIESANTTRNAQRVHLVMNMALTKAVDDGILPRNVAASVDKPGHRKTEQDTLTIDQAERLYRVAVEIQSAPGYGGPLLATRWASALWTGARPAELRGLTWDRVDLDAGVFDLSWQLKQMTKTHGCGQRKDDGTWPCDRKRVSYCPGAKWDFPAHIEYRECSGAMVWTRPKTDAGLRIVPIVAPLLDMLRAHRALTASDPNPHNLVWCHRDGRVIGEKREWELWKSALAAASLPDVDQYSTRHTTATLLDELGVSDEVRMQIMGQSSKVAHRAYLHVDQSRARAALDQLAGRLRLEN